MDRKNFLIGITGLLLGCVIGFIFANSLNKSAVAPVPVTATNPNSATPPGHPALNGNMGLMPQADVQAAIERAKAEPDNFEAQVAAAAMFYQIQRFEQAIELLKRANGLKPDDYGSGKLASVVKVAPAAAAKINFVFFKDADARRHFDGDFPNGFSCKILHKKTASGFETLQKPRQTFRHLF